MDSLSDFCNTQRHHSASGDLYSMRAVKPIFGTFDNTDKSIYGTRFTLTISNKNNFFILLHKQQYEKLADPKTRTYAIGQELNNIRKIVVDIDFTTTVDAPEESIFKMFRNISIILYQLFDCENTVYARHPNMKTRESDGKQYLKWGCHIVLDKYIDSNNKNALENTYQHIIRNEFIAKNIEVFGENFIDKALFRPHQIFWLYGGNKDKSNPYMELDLETLELINPYKKWIEMGMSFEEFYNVNRNFDFTIPTYDSFGEDDIVSKIFEPPVYIEEKIDNAHIHHSDYTTNFDLQDVLQLLDMIDGRKSEDYSGVRFPVIACISREFNHSEEVWQILKSYLEKWNCERGMQPDYHMDALKRSYFQGCRDVEGGYTIGTLCHLAKEHSPNKYQEWYNKHDWFDYRILYDNDVCEFTDESTTENKKPVKNKLNANSPFRPEDLNKIVKHFIKDSYQNIDDYENDRNDCINALFQYAKTRFFCLQKPINTVFIVCAGNNHTIERISDLKSTYKNVGKIPGTKVFFRDADKEDCKPTTDAITILTESQYRTIYAGMDFLPYNAKEIKHTYEQDGVTYVNNFTGYNPKIYYDDPVPDLSKYKPIIDKFISGLNLTQEQHDYIYKYPIWFQPVVLHILNIAGGIEYANYVLKYIAQIVQEPENLLPVGILFYSKCRQGKGLLMKTIADIIGEKHCVEVNKKDEIENTHSVPFEGTLVCNLNECNAKNFGKDLVDLFKSYIDGVKLRTANRKNIQAYQYTMRTRIIATTNNADGFAFDTENGNDRINAFSAYNYIPDQQTTRQFLSQTLDEFRKSKWYYRELYNLFNTIQYTESEILNIYMTDYMKDIMEADINPVREWINQLSTDETMIEYYFTSKKKDRIAIMDIGDKYVTATQLRSSFLDWCFKNNIEYKKNIRAFTLELSNYPNVIQKTDKIINHYTTYQINLCEF